MALGLRSRRLTLSVPRGCQSATVAVFVATGSSNASRLEEVTTSLMAFADQPGIAPQVNPLSATAHARPRRAYRAKQR